MTLGLDLHCVLGDDRALPHPAAVFAERPGVLPVGVPGTHEGMLTHPGAVAAAILEVT